MGHLVVFSLVAFITIIITTFGWRFWGKTYVGAVEDNKELAESLEQHVYKLSHEIGDRSVFEYDQLKAAESYITEQFTSFGYKVEFQSYEVSNKTVKNIIVEKTGLEQPNEIVIVGAHYDTCFNPGADDNASAVAGLLELARSLYEVETSNTLKFIAFVNEEPPFFKTKKMGSWVYAKSCRERKENIKGVIILEMIGYYSDKPYSQRYPPLLGPFYPNRGNFIGVVGNFNSNWLTKKVAATFKDHSNFPIESLALGFIPGADLSDHWSFWKHGYSAVMITDTAFFRNFNYHSSSDTYEKLDYVNMAEVVRGLSAVLIDVTK